MIKEMYKTFRLSDEEFNNLYKQFGDLTKFQSWQLIRKNAHNNHTDDLEDIIQDQMIAVIKAGVYYKRQVYIEESLRLASQYATGFVKDLVSELERLWSQRTKHGANRQKFGEYQEKILESIIRHVVPAKERPDPRRNLVVDGKFARYCKQITWNQQKSLGKKITKERSLRIGMVSLSQHDHAFSMGTDDFGA